MHGDRLLVMVQDNGADVAFTDLRDRSGRRSCCSSDDTLFDLRVTKTIVLARKGFCNRNKDRVNVMCFKIYLH